VTWDAVLWEIALGVAQAWERRFLRTRTWRVIRFFLGMALAGLALYALNGQRGELVGASAILGRLRIVWLLLAIAAEVASFVSFGALQRKLLGCGGAEVRLSFATALSMAAGAIASSLPGGPAFSSVYAFRQYRRKGVDEAVAGWILLATLVCAALGLGLLATAGVLVAFRQGSAYDLIGVVLGVLVVAAVADAIVWQRRWLATMAIKAMRLSRRLINRPRREAAEVVEELVTRLSEVQLTWKDAVLSLLAGVGDWAFDCAALALSFLAVGAPVPWHGLLLAYGAGMLAANLPVTPGGLGVVEGSLTIALVAFGGAELSTVAAVLCYRIVSFWGYLPVGWASWGAIALAERRARSREHGVHVPAEQTVPTLPTVPTVPTEPAESSVAEPAVSAFAWRDSGKAGPNVVGQ
jgi:uncharacterized protein (TIRG00374 family)